MEPNSCVCFDCGTRHDQPGRCVACKGDRVGPVTMISSLFGNDWEKNFDCPVCGRRMGPADIAGYERKEVRFNGNRCPPMCLECLDKAVGGIKVGLAYQDPDGPTKLRELSSSGDEIVDKAMFALLRVLHDAWCR